MPDTSGGWVPTVIGAVLGLSGIVGGWFQARRKADVDESALVLTAWKNLMETTEKRVSSLVAEVEGLQRRLSLAENRITELEGERLTDRRRIAELETENAGLKRAIAQNSKSTAFQIGETKAATADMREQISALDQAGHNSKGGK